MSKKNNKKFDELEYEIDIPQLLLHSRNILLHGTIDVNASKRICEDLLGLDQLSNDPIALWINTRGGSIDCGFSIIDTMLGLKAPVYTIICGSESSVGALISIIGSKRVMTEHSFWMIHDMTTGCYPDGEYFAKIKATMDQHYSPMWEMIKKHLKNNTNLTNDELELAKNTELHLMAKEAKKKGIVDAIVKYPKRKKK